MNFSLIDTSIAIDEPKKVSGHYHYYNWINSELGTTIKVNALFPPFLFDFFQILRMPTPPCTWKKKIRNRQQYHQTKSQRPILRLCNFIRVVRFYSQKVESFFLDKNENFLFWHFNGLNCFNCKKKWRKELPKLCEAYRNKIIT